MGSVERKVRPVAFVASIVFGIVHLVCCAVPGHAVSWSMAVPQQHATLEHFGQTGTELHPALSKRLCNLSGPLMKNCVNHFN